MQNSFLVNNSVTASANPVVVPSPTGDTGALEWARWEVQATDGTTPQYGGLPGILYVNRVDTVGGKPSSCPASTTQVVPYQVRLMN